MALESGIRRTIRRLGEAVEIRNYDGYGTEDDHGDADPQLSADSPFTGVPARADTGTQPESERGRAFTSLDYDMVFTVPDNEVAVSGLSGAAESEHPSEVERVEGDNYRVLRVARDRNGAVSLYCEVQEP